jgi:hypothetical protein
MRAVNASIIEAELVTKHLLCVFVGLNDEHFRSAMNALQNIVQSTSKERNWATDPICTVITEGPRACLFRRLLASYL